MRVIYGNVPSRLEIEGRHHELEEDEDYHTDFSEI